METVEMRPMTLGELLDRTFTLYRRHFLLFAGIMALPQLVILAIVMIFAIVAVVGGLPGGGLGGMAAGFGLLILVMIPAVLISFAMAQGATVFAVAELFLGRPVTLKQSFSRVRGNIGSMIGTSIYVGLAVMGGFILLIIPGFYMLARTCVAVPSCFVEELGPSDAYRRSMNLTKDHAGRGFMIVVFVFLIGWIVAFLFQFPFEVLKRLASGTAPSIVLVLLEQLSSLVANVLVGPIGTIAFSLFYFDLRVRKEAFDLQVMMKALDPNADLLAAPGGGATIPKQFS